MQKASDALSKTFFLFYRSKSRKIFALSFGYQTTATTWENIAAARDEPRVTELLQLPLD